MFVHNTEPSFSSLKMGYPNYIIILIGINRENDDSCTLPVGLGVAHFQTHPVLQDSPMGVQDGEEGLPWGLSGRAAHVVHASQEFSCGPGNKNRRGDENQQQQWPEIGTNVMNMGFMLFFIFLCLYCLDNSYRHFEHQQKKRLEAEWCPKPCFFFSLSLSVYSHNLMSHWVVYNETNLDSPHVWRWWTLSPSNCVY